MGLRLLASPRRISLLGGGESTRRSAVIASWLVEVRCSRRLFHIRVWSATLSRRLDPEFSIIAHSSREGVLSHCQCEVFAAAPSGISCGNAICVAHYSQSLSALKL